MQSVWIGIWSLIEGGGDGLKMKKLEKLQGRVGKACFSISHSYAKWNRMGVGCSILREKWKEISHDHAKFSHSHVKRSRETKMKLMDFPLRTIMRNCWGLMRKCIFSKFLDEEASRRPLRWCQVSTWPWPINRNVIDSFRNFWYIF